jgi:quercetin dioxygenase-like cupin family protein
MREEKSTTNPNRGNAMKKLVIAAALLIGTVPFLATAQEAVVSTGDDLKWGPASPALPTGAQGAALVGDPAKEGLYVVRVKFPAGYKVAPHSHPNDENVTVISGMFHIGIGDKFDDTKGQALKPGGFAQAPKGVKHYAWASQETIIQLHGMGPQNLIYVNAADDPRKK